MRASALTGAALALSIVFSQLGPVRAQSALTPQDVLATMQRAADWQLAHPAKHAPTHWTTGVYNTGLIALAGISPNPVYQQTLLDAGALTHWQLGPRRYVADDQVVVQTYLDLYARYHEPGMLQPARSAFDAIIQKPAPNPNDLRIDVPNGRDKWSWCDALFMAPAAWARLTAQTGDPRYLNWMDRHFWQTVKYLYDRKQHLFYRDYTFFTWRESNGRPVFWGRGNGWVIAGIARILETMPDNYPSRPRYVQLFRQLAARLASLQDPSGAWHSSLLDPELTPAPEMSATGLIGFAFAWGVNAGILDRTAYEPRAMAAWNALVAHLTPDGRLTFVQQTGLRPEQPTAANSEVYGTGALLLAGAEMYKMQLLAQAPHVRIHVANPLPMYRFSETISVFPFDSLRSLRTGSPEEDMVISGSSGRVVDSQVTSKAAGSQSDALIFQTDIAPKAAQDVEVVVRPAGLQTPAPLVKTFARYVPERQDDFAWENDRIAHRVYGPTLAKVEGTNNSGIDVWVKSSRGFVADIFYKRHDYHVDHGLGGDFYDNGTSRGDGGSGIWSGDTLYVSNNYASQQLVSSGPIRAEFILTYGSWQAGNRTVSEIKRFRLDAGSNMTRIDETLLSPQPGPLNVGIAVVSSDWPGRHVHSKIPRDLVRSSTPPADLRGRFVNGPNWIADFQGMAAAPKGTPDNGMVGVAEVLAPPAAGSFGYAEGHEILTTQATPGVPLTYYVGAGWSKFDFPSSWSWESYVANFATRLKVPLRVTVGR